MLEEKTYRQLADLTFRRVEAAFDEVDPDLVEPIRIGDTLTLAFGDGSRAILSLQPPVRQIWLAARARGYHFGYEPGGDRWIDREGHDLAARLSALVQEATGLAIAI